MARAQYASDRLEEWMRADERALDSALMGSARAYIEYQPKGVVGNIVPWNFPFDLSVGPLIEMLAAGNRVIIKPSEHTPACAMLLQSMISSTFSPDLVYVAVGGVELARAFASLPGNHLLYTGGAHSGKQVMQAAARNLTPVTLELGGKCPRAADSRLGQCTKCSVHSRHQVDQEWPNVHFGGLLPRRAQRMGDFRPLRS